MNLVLRYLAFGMMVFAFLGCDPEYNYKIKGTVLSKDKRLGNVEIKYHFLPKEKAENWRANISDSIVETSANGNFIIDQSTVSLKFDSVRISIENEGFDYYEIISNLKDWSRKLKLNKSEYIIQLDPIVLTKEE